MKPKDFEAEVIDIINQTPDVKTIRLKIPEDIEFIPGQFCMVKIDKKLAPFTFASAPQKGYTELTIKQIGEVTKKMHNLKKGDKIQLRGPFGKDLNFENNVKKHVGMVAAGSGITPFMSIIEFINNKKLENYILLIYANRTREDIIYKNKLDDIVEKNNNIKVVYSLTKEDLRNKGYEFGHVTQEMILKHSENPQELTWYICGPPNMNKDVKKILKKLKAKDIRIESWEISGKFNR